MSEERNAQKALGIKIHADGTVTRSKRMPVVPPSCSPDGVGSPDDGVLSKDVTLDPTTKLRARVFLPQQESPRRKLPLMLYFHGGGFVLYSPGHALFHDSCRRMAKDCGAIVVSVDYRLAPENRLPAAYEDAFAALQWLRSQALGGGPAVDPWFESRALFSECFLVGNSSGGNIVYNLGLRIAGTDLRPLKVSGAAMHQPYFGGTRRTGSELKLAHDMVLPLHANDLLWSLALPDGADRDHDFCNPLERGCSVVSDRFPRSMVVVGGFDPLRDRHMEFVKTLKERGVDVVLRSDEEGFHGDYLFHVAKARALHVDISRFIYLSSTPSSL